MGRDAFAMPQTPAHVFQPGTILQRLPAFREDCVRPMGVRSRMRRGTGLNSLTGQKSAECILPLDLADSVDGNRKHRRLQGEHGVQVEYKKARAR